MCAYTLEIPASPDVYLALHRAVVEVVNETGGGEGLHLVRETDGGCADYPTLWVRPPAAAVVTLHRYVEAALQHPGGGTADDNSTVRTDTATDAFAVQLTNHRTSDRTAPRTGPS